MEALRSLQKQSLGHQQPFPHEVFPLPIRPPSLLNAELRSLLSRVRATTDETDDERGAKFLEGLGISIPAPGTQAKDVPCPTRTFRVRENVRAMELETFLDRVHESRLAWAGDDSTDVSVTPTFVADHVEVEKTAHDAVKLSTIDKETHYELLFKDINLNLHYEGPHSFFEAIRKLEDIASWKMSGQSLKDFNQGGHQIDGNATLLSVLKSAALLDDIPTFSSVWNYINDLLTEDTQDEDVFHETSASRIESTFHENHLSGGGYDPVLNRRIIQTSRRQLELEFAGEINSILTQGAITRDTVLCYLRGMYPRRVSEHRQTVRVMQSLGPEEEFPMGFELENLDGSPVWVFVYLSARSRRYDMLNLAIDHIRASANSTSASAKLLCDSLGYWSGNSKLPATLRERVAREYHIMKRSGGDPYKQILLNLVGLVEVPKRKEELPIRVSDFDFLWFQLSWIDPEIPEEEPQSETSINLSFTPPYSGTSGYGSSPRGSKSRRERHSLGTPSSLASAENACYSLGWLQRNRARTLSRSPPDAALRCLMMTGAFAEALELLIHQASAYPLCALHAVHLALVLEAYGLTKSDYNGESSREFWELFQGFLSGILNQTQGGGAGYVASYILVLAVGATVHGDTNPADRSRVLAIRKTLRWLLLKFGPLPKLFGNMIDDARFQPGFLFQKEVFQALRVEADSGLSGETFGAEILVPAAVALREYVLSNQAPSVADAHIKLVDTFLIFCLAQQQDSALSFLNTQLSMLVEAAAHQRIPKLSHLCNLHGSLYRGRVSSRAASLTPLLDAEQGHRFILLDWAEDIALKFSRYEGVRWTCLFLTLFRALCDLNHGRVGRAMQILDETDLLPRGRERTSLLERALVDETEIPFLTLGTVVEVYARVAERADQKRLPVLKRCRSAVMERASLAQRERLSAIRWG